MPNSGIALVMIAALSGAMITLQAGVNGSLGRTLGHPFWATLVSLVVSILTLVPLLVVLRPSFPNVSAVAQAPLWIWIGGVFGMIYVTTALILAPKIGAAAFMTSVIAGQMMAAVVVDQYGLAGFPEKPVNLWRIVGIVLIVSGVVIVQKASAVTPQVTPEAQKTTPVAE